MVLPDHSHQLEVAKLKLAREHFPLSLSLHRQILDTYAEGLEPVAGPVAPLEQLLSCLSNLDEVDLPLVELIDRSMKSQGLDATPGVEQRAILTWLDNAHRDWITRYPLAEPLAQVQKNMRPLAAALALIHLFWLTRDGFGEFAIYLGVAVVLAAERLRIRWRAAASASR